MLFSVLKILLKSTRKYAVHILLLIIVLSILMLRSGYLLVLYHLCISATTRAKTVSKASMNLERRTSTIYSVSLVRSIFIVHALDLFGNNSGRRNGLSIRPCDPYGRIPNAVVFRIRKSIRFTIRVCGGKIEL